MPAQKRSLPENFLTEGESSQHHNRHPRRSRHEREAQEEDEEETEDEQQREEHPEHEQGDDVDEDEGAEDSEQRSSSLDPEEKTEYIFVELPEIRKDVQCPICLGIIKKTRTVMECLHRFCRECIDKSMRLGNNECPACRTHCASRRSLRDDPNYDAFIAALYPDIEKYEEEELAFHEEERNRNKQIQASIAQISQRQSEALIKRRTQGKDTTMPRPQRNPRNPNSRRRRSSRGREVQVSDDNEDENNGGKDTSSNDEPCREIRQKRCKKRRSSQASSSAVNSDGGFTGIEQETKWENRGISPGLVWSPEMLAWGRGGARSHTRHGNNSSSNSKSSRSSRLNKLADYLQGLNANKKEETLHLILIPLDEKSTPVLQQPHIYCQPTLSVQSLCDYVALNTPLRSDEVEISVVKSSIIQSAIENGVTPLPVVAPQNDDLQALGKQGTLAEIGTNGDHLLLAYRRKDTTDY